MICFVTTHAHGRTHAAIKNLPGAPSIQLWSYDRLLRARRLPRATWIFTDLDRLGFWELELAAHVYRQLKAADMTVLNDPARIGDRHLLLRQLYASGFNRFTSYSADGTEQPQRYPVFLRTNRAHRGVISDLIESAEELEHVVEEAVSNGYPLRELLIIEFCAQPVRSGLFRKHAAFRCGARIIETTGVLEQHWAAKQGAPGLSNEDDIEKEYLRIRDNPNQTTLLQAFEIGHIEYGRADYVPIDGEVQIYEINTNPWIATNRPQRFPRRNDSINLFKKRYADALHSLDTKVKDPAVRLNDEILKRQRRKDRLFFRSRWVP